MYYAPCFYSRFCIPVLVNQLPTFSYLITYIWFCCLFSFFFLPCYMALSFGPSSLINISNKQKSEWYLGVCMLYIKLSNLCDPRLTAVAVCRVGRCTWEILDALSTLNGSHLSSALTLSIQPMKSHALCTTTLSSLICLPWPSWREVT